MIGGRGKYGKGEWERGSQNKGGEARAKMDDGSKKRHLSGDVGVIERQVQIKPYAGRIWMMKPGV